MDECPLDLTEEEAERTMMTSTTQAISECSTQLWMVDIISYNLSLETWHGFCLIPTDKTPGMEHGTIKSIPRVLERVHHNMMLHIMTMTMTISHILALSLSLSRERQSPRRELRTKDAGRWELR